MKFPVIAAIPATVLCALYWPGFLGVQPGVSALEVFVLNGPDRGHACPPVRDPEIPVLISLAGDEALVGEHATTPTVTRTTADLREQLARLKRASGDRVYLVLRAEDDVRWERVVAAVDVATGLGYRPSIEVRPQWRSFGPDHWRFGRG